MAGDPLSLLSGASSLALGGEGSGFGDESSDLLQAESTGSASQSAPFTFSGDNAAPAGGAVPAWLIAAAAAALVAAVYLARR